MPRTPTAPREDPPTAYRRLKRDIETMLDLLAADVAAHSARASADPRNWGYAGDLGEIRSRLMSCLVFFGNYQDEDEGRAAIDKQIAAHR
jgi:hypothetical protein